jgi:hypothetical protein
LPASDALPPRRRRRTRPGSAALWAAYAGAALLAATGGARPTGIDAIDAVLLGLGGAALAVCGRRARTVPLFAFAGAAALLQPAAAPLALGLVALVTALGRSWRPLRPLGGIAAAGLAWAAVVGAPFEPGARPLTVPILLAGCVVVSARRQGSRRFRQRADRVAAVAGALAGAAVLLWGVAVVGAKTHADRGADLLDKGLDAARVGDTETALDRLRAAERSLGQAERFLGAAWSRPAWAVPGLSQNARVLHEVVTEIRRLAGVGVTSAQEADLEALRARQGAIDLDAVRAIEAPLVDVVRELRAVDGRLANLDGGWLTRPVDQRLAQARGRVGDALPSAELALDGVRAAPALLGGDGERTYLVLFTTPVEARAHLGFPGNFAEITFTDGRFEKTRFGRVTELNQAPGERSLTGPTEFLQRYGRFDPAKEWRSVTFSPDLPTVAQVVAELYPQSGGRAVDGVMTVDPMALGALLRFTGPIAVPGVDQPLTARTGARFLLRDQYVELPDNPERVDALEALSEQTFDRLTDVDLPGPGELRRVLGPVVEQGHLQLLAFDEAGASFLDGLGITGRLPPVEGDALAVTTSNAAMNKIDLFLRRALEYDVRWDRSTGEVRATATVTLTNEAPSRGLPQYLIGNAVGENRPGATDLPDGWNNVFLTLYSPWRVESAHVDGQPLALEVLPELGRNAISTIVELAPGQTRTLTFELQGVLEEDRYVLDLAAQPLVEPERVRVHVRSVGGSDLDGAGPVDIDGRDARGGFDLLRDERITLE